MLSHVLACAVFWSLGAWYGYDIGEENQRWKISDLKEYFQNISIIWLIMFLIYVVKEMG